MTARVFSVALALSLGGSYAAAQTPTQTFTPAGDTSTANAIALMRTDLRAQKAQVLGKALALSDADAKVFWPLQRQFEVETAKLWDERIKIIQDYSAQYNTLTDAGAVALAERMFKWEEKRAKLNRDQFEIFAKQLPGKVATHFFQLDGFLNKVIEVQIASAMPEVRQIKLAPAATPPAAPKQ
jgi:hypothetical protein